MAVAFAYLQQGASVVPADQLKEHVRQLLRMRLVAGAGIRIARCDIHGTALELADSGGSHGTTISSRASALPALFKPGCVPLKLCRAVMDFARTLPARGGRGVGVSQTGAGRLIALVDEGGDGLPGGLKWDAMFRSVDSFIEDWNAMLKWAAGIAPRAGTGIGLSFQADRTLVYVVDQPAGGGGEDCDEEDECECDECDQCEYTCDPCDPCDPVCDGCDPCQVCDPCDPCQADWCGEVDPYTCSP